MTRRRLALAAAVPFIFIAAAFAQQPQPQQRPSTDAKGNPIRHATKTGHVSNYDESKVGTYTLPDPLKLADGTPVRDAKTWTTKRRPEIVELYKREIYGRIPANVPKVTWQTAPADAIDHPNASVKHLVGKVGADGPQMPLTVYTPANAAKPVPVIVVLSFGGGGRPVTEPPNAADILAHGWGYAVIGYNDIQPDQLDTFKSGVIGATTPSGERAPDGWGTISAWAWGVSRVIDYLETDKAIDAKHIALFGHSRLGKTALWASALDTRIAAVYSSCSGEMGAALSRRDFGETVDDMAQTFPYWFAPNFLKYAGKWNEMPVDAHMLIALSAPRPVFITGGTGDQWADPVGEFAAEVAAGPVYRLLGAKDLGTAELPAVNTPVISGDLGWYYHTGPHAATPADWQTFVQFLEKYFR
jgi:(4-O-methyl)-D-glucuronate---lignin esterase